MQPFFQWVEKRKIWVRFVWTYRLPPIHIWIINICPFKVCILMHHSDTAICNSVEIGALFHLGSCDLDVKLGHGLAMPMGPGQTWSQCTTGYDRVFQKTSRCMRRGEPACAEMMSHRIHGAGIYANIWGILMGSMLPYIAAPWILWVLRVNAVNYP